jgi:hypothetical protein
MIEKTIYKYEKCEKCGREYGIREIVTLEKSSLFKALSISVNEIPSEAVITKIRAYFINFLKLSLKFSLFKLANNSLKPSS